MTAPRIPAIFRFAPSPNGRLHLGHAYSALLNASLAAAAGGRFLLRMEDIDSTRCTPALSQHCLDDLQWLGLSWEEPVRVQSQHLDDYRTALSRLQSMGLAYPCFCSRSQVAATSTRTDPDGAPLYPGTCRQLGIEEQRARTGQPHSWRLDMAKAMDACPPAYSYVRFTPPAMDGQRVEASPELWGDVILARKDIGTSYHIAVVVDDALQGITHVVRGADLEASTSLHILLQRLLGLPSPVYHHHALLQDGSGEKLSKSRHSKTLAELRAEGMDAATIRKSLGF